MSLAELGDESGSDKAILTIGNANPNADAMIFLFIIY